MALTQVTSGGIKDSEVKNADMADDSVGIAELSATGTAGNTTYLRGDNTWTVPPDNNTVYTHPNHSGEVTSVADGATTITDDVVDEANLKISNAGSDGQYLQKQSGNTGGLTWATVNALGGGATGTDYDDNVKVRWGTGNDLEIYHDGSDSKIVDSGTGTLNVHSSGFNLLNVAGNENFATFTNNGAVKLYYDNNEKLATTDTGILLTGDVKVGDSGKLIAGDGDDFKIFHDGAHTYLDNYTGNIVIRKDNTETFIKMIEDGAVELYHNGANKFETFSSGVKINGNLVGVDNKKIQLGNDNDLQIYHDATDSYVKTTTGDLVLQSTADDIIMRAVDDIHIQTGSNSDYSIFCAAGGSVELYHNASKKFETTSTGCKSIGVLAFDDSDGNNNMIRLGGGADLQLYHNGTNNYIDVATTGQDLFFRTSVSGSGDTSSMTVRSDGSITHPDNIKTKWGASDDLQIYHDGSHSRIVDTGTGDLKIQTNNLQLLNAAGDEYFINGAENGAVDLYYDGSKKAHTTTDGLEIGDFTDDGSAIGVELRTSGGIRTSETSTDFRYHFRFVNPNGQVGYINTTGSDTNYNTTGSDRALKKNFEAWDEDVLSLFKKVNPQKFNFKTQEDGVKKSKGFIAQEMVDSFPEAYSKNPEVDGKYYFNPSGMVVYLTKALQEAITKIETLETKVAALEAA